MIDSIRQWLDGFWQWFAATFGAQPNADVKQWLEFGAALVGLVTAVTVPYQIYLMLWADPRQRRHEKARHAETTESDRRMLAELEELRRQNLQQQKQTALILAQLERLTGSPAQPFQAEALAQAVASAEAGAQAGDSRMRRALDLLEQGNVTEAQALFSAVAEEKESRIVADEVRIAADKAEAAEAFRNLGAIANFSDPKRARDAFAKAAQLDPENIFGMLWHAEMEKDAGNLAEAERAYNLVLVLA